jgi:hypothetical protein
MPQITDLLSFSYGKSRGVRWSYSRLPPQKKTNIQDKAQGFSAPKRHIRLSVLRYYLDYLPIGRD